MVDIYSQFKVSLLVFGVFKIIVIILDVLNNLFIVF